MFDGSRRLCGQRLTLLWLVQLYHTPVGQRTRFLTKASRHEHSGINPRHILVYYSQRMCCLEACNAPRVIEFLLARPRVEIGGPRQGTVSSLDDCTQKRYIPRKERVLWCQQNPCGNFFFSCRSRQYISPERLGYIASST